MEISLILLMIIIIVIVATGTKIVRPYQKGVI